MTPQQMYSFAYQIMRVACREGWFDCVLEVFAVDYAWVQPHIVDAAWRSFILAEAHDQYGPIPFWRAKYDPHWMPF